MQLRNRLLHPTCEYRVYKKAKAIIYPTEKNIKDYMSYQKMVMDRSSNFADVWRRTLWKTPELDYTLFRPTSKMAKEAWVDNRNEDVSQTIKNINERYGIFFIFRGDCPYCHKFAPILKSFQEKYGITIMPVSMDGGSLPDWQKFLVNKGQVESDCCICHQEYKFFLIFLLPQKECTFTAKLEREKARTFGKG